MWDLIVTVPDHCLSFYFETVGLILHHRVEDCCQLLSTRKVMTHSVIQKMTQPLAQYETGELSAVSRAMLHECQVLK